MRLTLSLFLCVFVPVFLMAQAPVPDFTASVTSGCSPLDVKFTDKSTGSPKSWNWDFGNGVLSTDQNPNVRFDPGVYTITLVVRNANGINQVTKTNYIVSNPSPTISFIADKTLSCLPSNVNFTDLSVANAGTIVKWEWNFGDNGTSSAQNPSHPYTKTGFYDVYLKVTSSTGCSAANSAGRYIRVVNGVKADFSFTGPTTCQPPFTVAYKNLTSGPGVVTYSWDLGNGVTTSTLSPTAIYNTGGSYTVKLSAQSDAGCSDAIQKTLPITGNGASFNAPANVCLGSPAVFQVTSVPTPTKVSWNFGDGTVSTQTNPSKIYTSPGTYTVTMYNTFAGCSDSLKKTVVVNGKPAVDFYSANANNCKAPYTVAFQNFSPDAVTSQWNFGDGTTSTAANPSHTYTTLGNFDVTLTITDSKGCTNTVKKDQYVHILAPGINLTASPGGVCVGQQYTPVLSAGTVDGIASYAWDFGDGFTTTAASPSHAYAAANNYTVKLTITTNGGCTASTTTSVRVGNPPVIDFIADKTQPCHSDSVRFTNLTTPAGYGPVFWDFGDGTTSTTPTNPQAHKFKGSGFFSVKLKVTSNGCTDSLTKSNIVEVLPPVAIFGDTVLNCANRTAIFFKDSSVTTGAFPVSYTWNFGDPANTTSNTAGDVSFTYPTSAPSAAYNVKLVIDNGACRDSIIKKVQLVNEKAAFTIDKVTLCRKDILNVVSTNTPAFIKSYTWIDDGFVNTPTSSNAFNQSYGGTGNHTIELITEDINGCTDRSAPKGFVVTGPTAAFSIAGKGGCDKSTITFTDASVSAGTINKWTFDFGDGVIKSFTAPPFTHVYADTGLYTVILTVYDNQGCQDTHQLSGGVYITHAKSSFGVASTVYCPGTPLQFADSSAGTALIYAWNFGDGTTDNVQNPLHTYPNKDSIYTVKLVVTDTAGCVDSLVRNSYISIRSPKALYSVTDTVTLCLPLETKFAYRGKDAESISWEFGDGGAPSSLDSTSHFYNAYGLYKAKLYAYGFGGCVDSATINVSVINPYSTTDVSFDPKLACNELTVNFTTTTPFGTSFYFNYGDGKVDTLSLEQNNFQHLYNLPNLYSPYMVLKDTVGCLIVIGGLGQVDIKGAVPLFGMDKNKFCDSGTVYFSDYSLDGNDKIVTRTWDFGDGVTTVTTKDAIHQYSQPGLYVSKLTVTTQYPCTQSFTDTVRVLATPKPIITSQNAVCTNLVVDFAGSLLVPPDTAITWKWDLSGGKTSNLQNVSVNYPDTGLHHITLQATNSLGCKGDTAKDVMIFPLPAVAVSGDTSLIAGAGGITIPLTYSANAATFNWSPATNLSCTNCGNPFATPKFTTTYNVKVTDENGCVSSRNVTLVVICNNKNFFIPNTFSPNNDGSNDRFYPRGTGLDRIQALRIFNRWGELVFEKRNFPANDAASGWDGSYKGKQASTDTYIYMIDIICENANIITYKGNITLIR